MRIVLGGLLILYGLIILSGKKFMLHTLFYQIFAITPLFGGIFIEADIFEILFTQGFLMIWAIFIAWNGQGYMIHNVNKSKVEKIVKEILEKNKVPYEEKEETIVLSEWYNDTKVVTGFNKREKVQIYKKEIKITGDEVSASLHMKDLKGTKLYGQILRAIKERLPFLDKDGFSYSGFIMMLTGMLIIGVELVRKYDIFK
ncbi:hypothetical protein [Crassaminicella profunda]|uniref:hypothetical protein n=1 Tax=Crassaminicella profunda TaxID=1286698 RepID=UPI001CA63AFC|nr:hypothetical protein [Crassaminicella profunda]QZY53923.1 hypothetical protein K7H06_12765 [Crassaminicella profunda]